jgi:vesicle transport through interaction with t-SNAREs protein 1
MRPRASGSRRLENAQRIALETEDVGADILRNLQGQRETITHTRDMVSRPHTVLRRCRPSLTLLHDRVAS